MSEASMVGNPYVGPRTFAYADRERYFGREAEARSLLARVVSERLLLFYAQSGAGKSSLLHTRLIPQLEEEGFTVLPIGRVGGELPPGLQGVDNAFLFNLMSGLDQGGGGAAQWAHLALSEFLERLVTDDGQVWRYDPATSSEPATGDTPTADGALPAQRFALIIDQFEEIITNHPDRWQEREAFFVQLNQALLDDPNLWVVLTLREEYVAALDSYAAQMFNRLRARFYMQRMGVEAALDAVRLPAKRENRPFAEGVAEQLVRNLSLVRVPGQEEPQPSPHVEPLQLQVVCYQLWEQVRERPSGAISEADLPLGYIDQALTRFYEDALAETLADPAVQAEGVSERRLRAWFSEELITERGIRNTVLRDEETGCTGGLATAAADRLARRYLLRSEPRAGGIWVELVHDRFVEPIREANRAWFEQHQSLIAVEAQAWREAGRPADKLLRGDRLAEAQAQVSANAGDLTALDQEFMAASREEEDSDPIVQAARAWEEAGRPADRLLWGERLGEARSRMDARPGDWSALAREFVLASRGGERRAAARRQRRIALAAGALLALFAALAGWALWSAGQARLSEAQAATAAEEARQNESAARTSEAQAAEAAKVAAQAKETADAESLRANREAETAEAARAVAEEQQFAAEAAQDTARAAARTAVAGRNLASTLVANLEAVLTAQPPTQDTPPAVGSPTAQAELRGPMSTVSLATRTPGATTPHTPGFDRAATISAAQVQLADAQAMLNVDQVRLATLESGPSPAVRVATIRSKHGSQFAEIAADLGIEPGVAVAVYAVEAPGPAFDAQGRTTIRFETHIFYDKWGRQHSAVFDQHFRFNAVERWQGHEWRPATDQPWHPVHGSGYSEWAAFEFARGLSEAAAMYSIGMGAPQLMGFNYGVLRYDTVRGMFDAFSASESNQIVGFFNYVRGPSSTSDRLSALQSKDFQAFARLYNGPTYGDRFATEIQRLYDAYVAAEAS